MKTAKEHYDAAEQQLDIAAGLLWNLELPAHPDYGTRAERVAEAAARAAVAEAHARLAHPDLRGLRR